MPEPGQWYQPLAPYTVRFEDFILIEDWIEGINDDEYEGDPIGRFQTIAIADLSHFPADRYANHDVRGVLIETLIDVEADGAWQYATGASGLEVFDAVVYPGLSYHKFDHAFGIDELPHPHLQNETWSHDSGLDVPGVELDNESLPPDGTPSDSVGVTLDGWQNIDGGIGGRLRGPVIGTLDHLPGWDVINGVIVEGDHVNPFWPGVGGSGTQEWADTSYHHTDWFAHFRRHEFIVRPQIPNPFRPPGPFAYVNEFRHYARQGGVGITSGVGAETAADVPPPELLWSQPAPSPQDYWADVYLWYPEELKTLVLCINGMFDALRWGMLGVVVTPVELVTAQPGTLTIGDPDAGMVPVGVRP